MYEDANATLDLIERLLCEEREQLPFSPNACREVVETNAIATLREIPAVCAASTKR